MTDTTATHPYLTGPYEPVDVEHTSFDLPVSGELPVELDGRLLRIGPNPLSPPVDTSLFHVFSGAGMVHGVRLRAGKAEWYRNRWVRSGRVCEALGEEPVPGEPHGPIDNGNTNVIAHAGKLLAMSESGPRPFELDAELRTVARVDFEGTLPNGFTAHPKVDPLTGEMHAVAYYFGLPYVQYIVVGVDGRVRKVEPVSVPGTPMMHDLGLTRNFALLLDLPVAFDRALAAIPRFPYAWDGSRQARIGVLPREGRGTDVRWFEIEPCYIYHTVNAYDDGRTVVLDAVRHERVFDHAWWQPFETRPVLWRWTFDVRTGTTTSTQLDDRAEEFPRINDRFLSGRHRFSYGVELPPDDTVQFIGPALVKHDLATGAVSRHDFGSGAYANEAVFVPRQGGGVEDDGWLMSVVYDAGEDRSRLVVLNADDITGAPVAEVALPARVPAGFHGSWVAAGE
jgi:carotenoid cleavage dioxygenase-like enzyme